MKSQDLRASFLRYFEDRGHRVVPSSSLVPAGDPTLFFANAGMNQFKDVFTGAARRDYVRAASSQKCMRVSGKHNDFETVGRSLRHHTFFEMLGNFSFGDYFKREAIEWAWRLVTEEWKLDGARLVATVHHSDDEAHGIWSKDIGLGDARVYRLGDADNYWSMGDSGPNGPCSEIYVDWGPARGCGSADCSPACSCGRYLEFWNLVFMQFDRDASGRLTALPRPSIDTGMGLERISMILQDVSSNYDTDLFRPLLDEIARRSGLPCPRVERGREKASEADEQQVSMRVMADHVRALTFLLADGVYPSNEGRGYILRKLLRRAAGHAGKIGLQAPVLSELTGTVVEVMGEAYPDLRRQAGVVRSACAREELAFQATLEKGSGELAGVLARVRASGGREIPGDEAFRLHDTFGFPVELTVELARQHGLGIDRAGFDAALNAQKERARAAAKTTAAPPALPAELQLPVTEFRGYQETFTDGCKVLALVAGGEVVSSLPGGSTGWLVLDRTPFYAESGGQVGDTGLLLVPGEETSATVSDTQALRPGVNGHLVSVLAGTFRVGQLVRAEVDEARRRRIMANHTATHLLHRALKEVLGPDARQAGSLVAPDRLRFDFTWHQAVTPGELRAIEESVNAQVFAHRPVTKQSMAYQAAIDHGAVAMFGEKYGDTVRVVAVGDWSVELCGGTHCDRTEQIGALRIVSERGIAAGVRRIEAITGPAVHERLAEDEALLGEVERALKAPRAEVLTALERLSTDLRGLKRELDETRRKAAEGGASGGERHEVAGLAVEIRVLEGLDQAALREIAEGARAKAQVDALLLATEKDGKAALVLALTESLAQRLDPEQGATKTLSALAKEFGGGGGGRQAIAWAGLRDASRMKEALARFPALLGERLSGGGS